MMNKIEEAIILATVMHQGKLYKLGKRPTVLHPLEVAQILSTMTDDEDVIAAGILHEIVTDTDGTLKEIEHRFGSRVAFLVSSISENSDPDELNNVSRDLSKEELLTTLKNSQDQGVRMLWLADKLANIRILANRYSEYGEELWGFFRQKDPEIFHWYYRTIAELLELSLNKTGAFKEMIKHINSIWPGTFSSEKAFYKRYREVSLEGCKMIGFGAKGEVYRYNDELVIKVYNQKNTYHDVEREIALSRKAFVLGIPTAISFGIVAIGEKYGAMYELVESETLSSLISRFPGQIETYAELMAEVALTIHGVEVPNDEDIPAVYDRVYEYIDYGIGRVDKALALKVRALLDALPASDTLLHGDFHTGNVFLQNGDPLLIDMDRLAKGPAIIELSDLCYFYNVLGEEGPEIVEHFMKFSYETACRFFRLFLKYYLKTEDENKLDEVTEKASLIAYSRLIRRLHKKRKLFDADKALIDRCADKIAGLTDKLNSLEIY